MICLSLRFFLTLFFLAFLRTLVRILLVFLSGAAFRYFGFSYILRLNLLPLASWCGTAFRHYGFSFLFGLNLLLLASVCGTDYKTARLHSLCRLNLLNHPFYLTRGSRRCHGIDR